MVVIFEVRNFLAPNPGICEVPGGNPLGKIIYESVIFTRCPMTLKFHEMSYNDVKGSIHVFAYNFRLDEDRDMG